MLQHLEPGPMIEPGSEQNGVRLFAYYIIHMHQSARVHVPMGYLSGLGCISENQNPRPKDGSLNSG